MAVTSFEPSDPEETVPELFHIQISEHVLKRLITHSLIVSQFTVVGISTTLQTCRGQVGLDLRVICYEFRGLIVVESCCMLEGKEQQWTTEHSTNGWYQC